MDLFLFLLVLLFCIHIHMHSAQELKPRGIVLFTAKWCGKDCKQWIDWARAHTYEDIELMVVDIEEEPHIADLWNMTELVHERQDTLMALPQTACVYDDTTEWFGHELTEDALDGFMKRCAVGTTEMRVIHDMQAYDEWVGKHEFSVAVWHPTKPVVQRFGTYFPHVAFAWVVSDYSMSVAHGADDQWTYGGPIFTAKQIARALLGRRAYDASRLEHDVRVRNWHSFLKVMLYVDGCALDDVDDFLRRRPTVGIVRGDVSAPFHALLEYRSVSWDIEGNCSSLFGAVERALDFETPASTRPWRSLGALEHPLARGIVSSDMDAVLNASEHVRIFLYDNSTSTHCLDAWYDSLERFENDTSTVRVMIDPVHNDHERFPEYTSSGMQLLYANSTLRKYYACTDRT